MLVLASLEEDKHHALAAQDVPVALLQRRTGHDARGSGRGVRPDPFGDGFQPGPPVLVGQRLAGLHFGHVRRRVQVVAFGEIPSEPAGHEAGHS